MRHLQVTDGQHVLSCCRRRWRSTSHTVLQRRQVEHVDFAIVIHIASSRIIGIGSIVIGDVLGCFLHISLVNGTTQINITLLKMQAQAELSVTALCIEYFTVFQTAIVINPVAETIFTDIYPENMIAITIA